MCSLGDHDDEIQHTKRNSILDTETQPFDNELIMGSLGDHDDDDIPHIKRNLILNTETQPFDNELTTGSLGDYNDEIQHSKRNSILAHGDIETQPFDNELTMGVLGDNDDEIQHTKRNSILDHGDIETQPFDNELTMGALGDNDDEIQHTKRNSILDCGDIETQPFDNELTMGSLRENDNEIQYTTRNSILDCGNIETQPFDSQYSPLPGERFEGKDFDELQFLQNTLPFVDTVPFEDAFEIQIMNFGGETQVLDDLDGVENMATQLLDESDNEVVDTDGEGTDRTEILGDTEESSDDDPVERVGTYPVDQEHKLCKQDDRELKTESDGLSNEQHSAELDVSTARLPGKDTPKSKPVSVRRDFTSVRAAALRASGLAARNKAFKGTNSESCSIKNEDQFSKQHTSTFREEVDQEDFQEEHNEKMKGLRDENKCKVGSSTVRRLFLEDTLAEPKGPNDDKNNADGGADLSQLPACGNEMAGLSYVDSQEPGDLSQANALDVVDRYLQFNVMDFNQKVGFGSSTGRKSKPDSSAKGTQSLVKITNLKITAGEREIFDWDDSREDEGGGEFFTKKKEAFFDNGGQRKRSVSKPRKHLDSKRNGVVDETRDKEDQQDIHQKVKGLLNSNSGLVLRNSKRNDKTAKVTKTKSKKNLTKELDEPLNIGSSDGMEATGTDKDMAEVLNVGFDTQMAAEAMEVLYAGLDMADHGNKDIDQGTKNMFEASPRAKKNRAQSKENFLRKRSISSSFGVITRNSKKTKSIGNKLRKESTVSSQKQAKNVRKQCDTELVKEEMKKAKSNAEGHFATNRIEKIDREQIEEERALKRNDIDVVDRCHVIAPSSGYKSVKKRSLQEQLGTFTPIARRTRQRRVTNQMRDGITSCDSTERLHLTETRQGYSTGSDAFKMVGKEKFSKLGSNQSRELENVKLTEQKKSHQMVTDTTTVVGIGPLRYNKGKRTRRKFSELVNQSVGLEADGQSLGKLKRSEISAMSTSIDLGIRKKARSSACAGPVLRSSDRQSKGSLFQRSVDKGGLGDASLKCNSVDGNLIPKDVVGGFASKQSDRNSDADTTLAGEAAEVNARFEVSPGDRCKQSGSTFTTTVNCTTPINAASPICKGDEYFKQSCRKNLSKSLMKEISSLVSNGPEPTSIMKDSRRRRDMANVRVLFSHHLDDNTIKQQKKVLARFGASVASSISEATQFITDKFVRTRNMLEAIAFGKPVVTHLWLESCGETGCFMDERNYILRDAKKEKEFGFSLPVSLARASQRPLLQGLKVLITPNTKPSKEILASLVKAVNGLAMERIGRSAFKDDKIPDDLLVLSCEEDYALCVPFLEKGATVYSSELLLNGIVTQKLEYERHRLFADHVKKTRSTIWLKQDSNQYLPVTKCK
ncbi:hypothetical protein ACSBR1_013769 [Camellia fascicularis]